MKQNLNLTHKVTFKPGSSFSERESLINKEILNINDVLRKRGFYPLNSNVTNKNDKHATIVVVYQA
jgi:hypothetical protein